MKPVANSLPLPEYARVSTGQKETISIFPTILTKSEPRRGKGDLELKSVFH